MSVIHVPKRPELGFRQLLLLIAVALAMLAVFLRLWYLQVVKASELSEQAISYSYDSVPSLAPRGLIVDRNGRLLAGVHSELVITAMPSLLKTNRDELKTLAALLSVPEDKLLQKLENERGKPFIPCPVYTGASIEVAGRIAEEANSLPGIDVESSPIRYYPDPIDFSHVLGYVWTPNARDISRLAKQNIKPAEYVGKIGIEANYERDLMGTPGTEELLVDSKKRPMQLVSRDSAVPGKKLMLTLDSDVQKSAMEMLEEVRKESPDSGGAAVAIDPATGEILCLASNPSYDASLFLQGIKGADYQALTLDPMKPLFNRAIDGAYSPGSTFKIVSTLAAGKAGTFDPNRTVYCPGYFKVGNRKIRCLGHHGALSYEEALIKSCNTYFCDLAMRTGPKALCDEALDVGLGRRSGIDLPGEAKAIVPSEEWLRAVQKTPVGKNPAWYPGDTANLGIGQGELVVTPLQMADLACLVANQGVCYRPHLVKGIYSADSPTPSEQFNAEPLYQTDVPSNIWADLKQAMIGVIDHGTARRAEIPGLVWAGKTGSTEHSGPDKKTHSWFVGYAPADNPRIAVAVLVESGGHGGTVAAPIGAAIVKRYLEELKLLSTPSSDDVSLATASSAQAALPLSLRPR